MQHLGAPRNATEGVPYSSVAMPRRAADSALTVTLPGGQQIAAAIIKASNVMVGVP